MRQLSAEGAALTDETRSMVLGPSALYVVALAALVLTLTRHARLARPELRDRVVRIYAVGIAAQCAHLMEEFVTGFHIRLPELLGLVAWSGEFFLVVNVTMIAVWVVSILGIRASLRVALFPAWVFAVAMLGNGLSHPLLAVATGGYFPGLLTAPVVGTIGWLLSRALWELTSPAQRQQTIELSVHRS